MPKNSSNPRARSTTKPKLLFDENMPIATDMPRLNNRFSVKHIASDYKKARFKDIEVYELAKREKRIVVTFNIKHFRSLGVLSKSSGVIGVSPNLSTEQIDKKLTSLLSKNSLNQLYGKFTTIN